MLGYLKRWLDGFAKQPLRILVIDDVFPDPAMGSGYPRAARLLSTLSAAGSRLTHFSTGTPASGMPRPHLMLPDVAFVPREGAKLKALDRYLKKKHARFDAILVSRRHNLIEFNHALARYPEIAASKIVIFDSEAIFAEREALQRNVLQLEMKPGDFTVEQELELARAARIVIAVNEQDAAQYRTQGYADVRVLGHAVTPAFDPRPFWERQNLLFVGPTYADDSPNTDSVLWFVDQVLPLLRSGLQRDILLSMVGISSAPAIAARAKGRIIVHGAVRNCDELYRQARVFVAPTRFASGIPLKVYEASAHGVPCVVTPVLARQLGWQHEREVLVAETPEDFAGQCLRLFQDPALWERLRVAAFTRTTQDCGELRFDRTVAQLCADIELLRRAPHVEVALSSSR